MKVMKDLKGKTNPNKCITKRVTLRSKHVNLLYLVLNEFVTDKFISS
jgi:hypothetical protein